MVKLLSRSKIQSHTKQRDIPKDVQCVRPGTAAEGGQLASAWCWKKKDEEKEYDILGVRWDSNRLPRWSMALSLPGC